MKKVLGIALVAALALVSSVSAQQAQSKPDPAPAAKPADVAKPVEGKWDMTVASDQGPLAVLATFKLDGTKLSGSLNSQMGDTVLVGEALADKVTFTIQFDGGGGSMELVFTGAMKADGSLAGTLSSQMGDMSWTATRAKGL